MSLSKVSNLGCLSLTALATDNDVSNFFKEVEIMKRADGRDHPNVLEFIGVCTSKSFLSLPDPIYEEISKIIVVKKRVKS